MNALTRASINQAIKSLGKHGFKIDQMKVDDHGRLLLAVKFKQPLERPTREDEEAMRRSRVA